MIKILKGFGLIILIMILTLVWGIFVSNKIKVTNYIFKSDKIDKDVRIVQLTDVENINNSKREKQIISKIEKEKPDMIILTGDIVWDPYDDHIFEFLNKLKGIADMYYINGNHEYPIEKDMKIKERLSNMDVNVLDNYSIQKYGVNIIGYNTLPFGSKYKYNPYIERNTEEINYLIKNEYKKDTYNILLSHKPHFKEAFKNSNVDLILSGHAHGGQIEDPFHIIAAYAPDQGMFPKYFRGKHKLGNSELIISRGLDFNNKVPRVYNSREIVSIHIEKS